MRDEQSKIKLNFRVSSKVFEKMQVLVNNGEFEDISDVIVSALHQMLERSEKKEDLEEFVIHYLESDKGRGVIRTILLEEWQQTTSPGALSGMPEAISDREQSYTINGRRKQSSGDDQ
jgi:Arc/MetJ-type ribon-helix-helix transcriptional regulator